MHILFGISLVLYLLKLKYTAIVCVGQIQIVWRPHMHPFHNFQASDMAFSCITRQHKFHELEKLFLILVPVFAIVPNHSELYTFRSLN